MTSEGHLRSNINIPNRRQFNDDDIHLESWNASDERFLIYEHIYGSITQTFLGPKISVDQIILFRNNSWSLKTHFNAKMSEIRQKKSYSIYFFVRPQPHLDPKMKHFERIYGHTATVIGIMGNLNAQLEKKLLNSFGEKHCFMWKMAIFTIWTP